MEERMARMEKKLTEQARELADQKKKTAEQDKELVGQKEKTPGRNRLSWKVRVSELEIIIKKTHDADVLNDYQALKYTDQLDNQTQFQTALKEFKKAYKVTAGLPQLQLASKAPKGVIDILSL